MERELELELINTESKEDKIEKNTIGSAGQVAEIQAQVNHIDEIESFLLGNFDDNGKYEIPQDIIDEIVLMKKQYLYAFTDMVFCESEYTFEKFGKLQFSLKIEKNQKDEMHAKLYLEQEIKRAEDMFKKTAVTELASYSAVNSPGFINDCFTKFNIQSKTDDGLTKKEHSEEEPILVLTREKFLKERQVALDAQDAKYKDLLEKKLALLASYGFGKKIIEQFNAKKGKLNKYAKGYYRNLNNLIDQIMENNRNLILNNPMFIALWGKLTANGLANITKNVLKPIQEEVKKPETKKVEEVKQPVKPKVETERNKNNNYNNTYNGFGRGKHGHHHGPGPGRRPYWDRSMGNPEGSLTPGVVGLPADSVPIQKDDAPVAKNPHVKSIAEEKLEISLSNADKLVMDSKMEDADKAKNDNHTKTVEHIELEDKVM